MAVLAALARVAKELHADLEPVGPHSLAFALTLARRRTALAPRVLRFRVYLQVDEEERVVYFTETLWEQDANPRPGLELSHAFGPKQETFIVQRVGPPGMVEQQAELFAKRYHHEFDFAPIRQRLRDACKAERYKLRHLLPV